MSDTEWIESWHEYNDKNLPLSFADFCYRQGRADAIDEYKWISVNDKMPSDCNEDWVLVLPYDGDFRCIPTVAEYRRGHWYGHTFCTEDDCIDGEDSPFEVRFWKPIYDEFQKDFLEQLKEQKNGN